LINLLKGWRTKLLVVMGLLMIPVLLGACSSAEKESIRFADTQFESIWINNAVIGYIIEHGYDHPVEIVEMTTPIMQATLANGEIDVMLEGWQQNMPDWYAEEIAAGNIENLGDTYEGGPQWWIIPLATHEKHGITTVEDLKDHWELFKDPEDPSKGAFINCIIGWQCAEINEVKLEAYGLTDYYNILSPGSSGALDAALSGPQLKGKDVFGYYWAPTSLMGAYDWWVIEEPEYNAACWAKITEAREDKTLRPIDEACAYEAIPVDVLVNGGLNDKAPEIYKLLKNQTVGLDPINRTAAWALANDIQGDWNKAAVYYLTNYEDRWTSWMPEKNADKVKEALAAE